MPTKPVVPCVEGARRHDADHLRHPPYKVTTNSKHSSPIAPNLLERNFEPEGPNKTWVGDVTAIATAEGWGYLAVTCQRLDPGGSRAGRPTSLAVPDTLDRKYLSCGAE